MEFQDPTAQIFQQNQASARPEADKATAQATDQELSMQTESAWERGLRHAKEMKEKALRRKQVEKDQFDDKRMNLSLKEFENEKENDERYLNIEKFFFLLRLFFLIRPSKKPYKSVANADEDFEDEELAFYTKTNRLNQAEAQRHNYKATKPDDTYDKSKTEQRSRPGANKSMDQSPKRGSNNNYAKGRADTWHDPWERSRTNKKTQKRRGKDRRTVTARLARALGQDHDRKVDRIVEVHTQAEARIVLEVALDRIQSNLYYSNLKKQD